MMLDVAGEPRDLLALVRWRDRNQDRLIKAAADHLDLAVLHQDPQPLEIFRMMFFDPREKRAGVVKTDVDAGMFFEQLHEGQVAAGIGLLENVLEIAARLMRVNQQNQVELWRHGEGLISCHKG
jgi:hypothetical protein